MAIESAKIVDMIRVAKQTLNEDKNAKVVLFITYHNNIKTAVEKLKSYGVVELHGKITSTKKRDENLRDFQANNNKIRVLVGNPHVGDVGIDLDDKYGNHPRFMYIMPNYDFIELYQSTCRVNRLDSKSVGTVYFFYGQISDGKVKLMAEQKIFASLARKTVNAQRFILTKDPPPFPGDFASFIEE